MTYDEAMSLIQSLSYEENIALRALLDQMEADKNEKNEFVY